MGKLLISNLHFLFPHDLCHHGEVLVGPAALHGHAQ
jgi:hypothetical protein